MIFLSVQPQSQILILYSGGTLSFSEIAILTHFHVSKQTFSFGFQSLQTTFTLASVNQVCHYTCFGENLRHRCHLFLPNKQGNSCTITIANNCFLCRFGVFSVILVQDMILPNCVWKAGRTAAAIRTTAVSCLWSLLKNQTISQDQVNTSPAMLTGSIDHLRAMQSLFAKKKTFFEIS